MCADVPVDFLIITLIYPPQKHLAKTLLDSFGGGWAAACLSKAFSVAFKKDKLCRKQSHSFSDVPL